MYICGYKRLDCISSKTSFNIATRLRFHTCLPQPFSHDVAPTVNTTERMAAVSVGARSAMDCLVLENFVSVIWLWGTCKAAWWKQESAAGGSRGGHVHATCWTLPTKH